jgi:spore coat polysaccharide biosynthesis protein SpsF
MILGVLQARVSSSRLPGKVLREVLGRPMLSLQIERLRRSRAMQALTLATSDDPSDDALAELARAEGLDCFRGSLDDVLDRVYQAARRHAPDHVVRLTGDCPLADPALIDLVIERHLAEDADYTSNALEPTYPDGLDVEVVRFRSLEQAWREARLPSQREHVTPFLYADPKRFRVVSVKSERDLSRLRFTVDSADDFQFVERIYAALHPSHPAFTTADVLALLDAQPELLALNAGHVRNEGYSKSLQKDQERQTR